MKASLGKEPWRLNYPMLLFVAVIALIGLGVVMVYCSSAAMAGYRFRAPTAVTGSVDRLHLSTALSAAYLKKQTIWAALGIFVIIFCYGFRLRLLPYVSLSLLPVATFGLCIVFLFPEVNGSKRWIPIGPFTIQPSEFAKLGTVLFMAWLTNKLSPHIHSFQRYLAPSGGFLGVVLLLIFLEPDYGATAVLASIVFTMWFVAGARTWHLASIAAPSIIVFGIFVRLNPLRWGRMIAFLDPEGNKLGSGWQVYQSLVALGSGGFDGVGLGRSMQKFFFLSEAHTDFIASIIGEEIGLLGLTGLMVVFGILIAMGLRVARQTPDFYEALVAYGLTAMIAFPTLINFGVATSCLPAKGLALPFISYGGSSMVVNCAAIGILMNIAAANYAQSAKQGGSG